MLGAGIIGGIVAERRETGATTRDASAQDERGDHRLSVRRM